MHVIIIAIYGAHLTGCFHPTKKNLIFQLCKFRNFMWQRFIWFS